MSSSHADRSVGSSLALMFACRCSRCLDVSAAGRQANARSGGPVNGSTLRALSASDHSPAPE
jgi:hypothetical protein